MFTTEISNLIKLVYEIWANKSALFMIKLQKVNKSYFFKKLVLFYQQKKNINKKFWTCKF